MRLWTFQPERVYEILQKDGIFRCEPMLSECITECNFAPAYNWLVAEMKKRVGEPPVGVKYPIWAWHTHNWEHKKPDLRLSDFWYSSPMLCIEIEVPDEQVLLSDEENWHFVLNNLHISEDEQESNRIESLSYKEYEKIKCASWERIFDIEPFENDWTRKGCFIQATFWELKKEMVISIRKVKAKLRH